MNIAEAQMIADTNGQKLSKDAPLIIKAIRSRGGHCPCDVIRTASNMCPCFAYRKTTICECRLFVGRKDV